jgi:hypothetical protein
MKKRINKEEIILLNPISIDQPDNSDITFTHIVNQSSSE